MNVGDFFRYAGFDFTISEMAMDVPCELVRVDDQGATVKVMLPAPLAQSLIAEKEEGMRIGGVPL